MKSKHESMESEGEKESSEQLNNGKKKQMTRKERLIKEVWRARDRERGLLEVKPKQERQCVSRVPTESIKMH